jgi:hypothetical protein
VIVMGDLNVDGRAHDDEGRMAKRDKWGVWVCCCFPVREGCWLRVECSSRGPAGRGGQRQRRVQDHDGDLQAIGARQINGQAQEGTQPDSPQQWYHIVPLSGSRVVVGGC